MPAPPRKLLNRRRSQGVTGLLLLMLLFRAYVPVGFMPAAGTPFGVELCPAIEPLPVSPAMPDTMDMPAGMQMPAGMPMHGSSPGHHHDPAGAHGHFAHCPFGSAPSGAPIAQWPAPAPAGDRAAPPLVPPNTPPPPSARVVSAHQPRGPPLAPA